MFTIFPIRINADKLSKYKIKHKEVYFMCIRVSLQYNLSMSGRTKIYYRSEMYVCMCVLMQTTFADINNYELSTNHFVARAFLHK